MVFKKFSTRSQDFNQSEDDPEIVNSLKFEHWTRWDCLENKSVF